PSPTNTGSISSPLSRSSNNQEMPPNTMNNTKAWSMNEPMLENGNSPLAEYVCQNEFSGGASDFFSSWPGFSLTAAAWALAVRFEAMALAGAVGFRLFVGGLGGTG